jgi:hypothetical protein
LENGKERKAAPFSIITSGGRVCIMGKTITTHNGSAANRAHNIRNPKATDKQEHIDKALKSFNETIIDEPPRDAYKRIFGQALEEYNEKQKRPERRIRDYYNHIEADKKKHPVYEMIIQVGDRYDTGIDAPVERGILKEFIAGWPERNPNLELIGAYLHADERDGTLHAHIDYIPVAHGYRNGLHTQNGLVKALGQQGFDMDRQNGVTAQIRWEGRENRALEELCNRHGIEVERPGLGRKHLDTPEYKELAKALAAGRDELKEIKIESDELKQQETEIKSRVQELEEDFSNLQGKVLSAEEVNAIEGKKTILGGLKDVSYEDFLSLKKTAEQVESIKAERDKAVESAKRSGQKARQTEEAADKKVKQAEELARQQIRQANEQAEAAKNEKPSIKLNMEVSKLRSENKDLNNEVSFLKNAIEKIISALPENMKNLILPLINPEPKMKDRNHNRDER